MDNLRLLILLIGVVLLGVIYLWERRRRARKDDWELPPDVDMSGEPVEPEVTKPEDEWDIVPLNSARRDPLAERDLEEMRGFGAQDEPLGDDIPTLTDVVSKGSVKRDLPELVLVLTVIADAQHPIQGRQLLEAARETGLKMSGNRLFHRMHNGKLLFSMANILEPGYFDPDTLDTFTTPGIALFLRLPGKSDGAVAVQQMIETARTLAHNFSARLCDERRQPLTAQGLARLLDKARPYRATTN